MVQERTDYDIPKGPPKFWREYHESVGIDADSVWDSLSRYRQIGVHMMHGYAFSEGVIAAEHWIFEKIDGQFFAKNYGNNQRIPYQNFLYGERKARTEDDLKHDVRSCFSETLCPLIIQRSGSFSARKYLTEDHRKAQVTLPDMRDMLKYSENLLNRVEIYGDTGEYDEFGEPVQEVAAVIMKKDVVSGLERLQQFATPRRWRSQANLPQLLQDTYHASEYFFHISKQCTQSLPLVEQPHYLLAFDSIHAFDSLSLNKSTAEHVYHYMQNYAQSLVFRGDNRTQSNVSLAGSLVSIAATFYLTQQKMKALGIPEVAQEICLA